MEENKKNTGNKGKTFPLPPKKKNTSWKKWVSFIWIGLIAVVLGISGLFFSVSQGFLGEMPDVKELENPNIFVASEIISSDGVVLGKFEKEKTQPIVYKDLPPYLIYALQAKEDERFKEHSGIDLYSIARAVAYGGGRGGGSTITQQLAKLLFTGTASQNKIERAFQKLKEWVVAVSLEKRYTKEEIITLYFNKFDFLFNANGIEMASRVYFNKKTSELTLPEAATFVAMLENPRKNNPYRYPEKAKERRNVVLDQMQKTGYINEETYQKAINTPIEVDFHPIKSITDGYSAYYKFYLRKEIDKYLEANEKETGKKLNLYKDGLKIYVTLDSKMQKYAEESIKEHLTDLQKRFDAEQRGRKNRPFYYLNDKQIKDVMVQAMKRTGRYKLLKADGMPEDSIMMEFKKPIKTSRFTWAGEEEVEMSPWDSIRYHKQIAQAGLMSMVPGTGEIKAWVGGIDWQHFQYDHIKQGKRQVGSTFKPFVYATAIMKLGMTPCSTVSNGTYDHKGWHVPGRGGMLTLKDALAHSQNPVAARLIEMTGVDAVIQTARDLGVTEDIPRNNTIALGSSDITIYEMLGAYSTFANYGNHNKPEMIWRIEDANGRVIKEINVEPKEVMNPMYAYTMIELMKGVAQYGTASGELGRRGISKAVEIAAKTGTTQNNSDGWFMGITPKLATGAWVGWEDRATHFFGTGEGQGAKMALPIWAIFMKKVWADKTLGITPDDKFVKPSDWKDGCSNLKGLGGGYGDDGSLQTIDEIKNPRPVDPTPKKPTEKKEDNINENLHSNDEVDFNK
ncbi:transglycosylase domain-containing protein [Chryseobacterium arthrosphaerae]|uniref:Peptidoglycan glycosyltransferase n=1 Tax=Chryseobacterium arthrosphaerae TaxID=651561 RepID=A0A1B8ZIK0_9FLAO|nr:transglycosylase domain-containing protein [Chryseobacterium arthrosphaerae]AYZ14570.1 peptidoglycan glycosyltransferase [Chryseobacterium arthrosphaerae]MDG4651703.1 transglycosylase domain-containing protein [Chryseobacterium arthrosphaerae]OCA71420.1 peptidoglycan glycosyltransferase [Chryseobacterium arthrosphaerae]QUY55404.1 transglycosylase domain-containing protein [Chryseobacterium arthrosphaerae]UEQ75313.1 transglycosylase domain-containing protein [Chryseobacterium arthrosphaerae]